jgi:HPt (histidine-containing phosphotransfer) domain-containing protein
MDSARGVELLDEGVLMALQEFRVAGEPDPAAEVAQSFLEVTPERLQSLRAAAARADADEVRRMAHQVRGSCGAVGATAMFSVASEIESLGPDTDALPVAERLVDLFAQTEPLLEAIVRDGQAPA